MEGGRFKFAPGEFVELYRSNLSGKDTYKKATRGWLF